MNTQRIVRPVRRVGLVLLVLLTLAHASARAGAEPAPASDELSGGRGFSYSFHYKFVAGATLQPRDSSSGWDYSGVGCVSLANGGELFNGHLGLPEGSRIDYLRIYYYDANANDSRAWITTYDNAGAFSDITTVTSTGSGGYGSQLSAYLGHVVNNASNSYVLNWDANAMGNSMRLCGLRIAYRIATQDVYMPLIWKG
jgi:hypothetical protein